MNSASYIDIPAQVGWTDGLNGLQHLSNLLSLNVLRLLEQTDLNCRLQRITFGRTRNG